ncbi:PREDICTED: uncharacterized protein LOC102006902 isoform X1 [Chinchilla lanigera]|uniref:uncharacterized protein LOC102006902 isoform X1 n=1 Tax=Chinchilla lanigera TaxID=34839 RepID=UPI0006980C80|nr:PREDICTED: uncharacterized protein LOC102006902 isoform X1 [Chinchilla lanigera]
MRTTAFILLVALALASMFKVHKCRRAFVASREPWSFCEKRGHKQIWDMPYRGRRLTAAIIKSCLQKTQLVLPPMTQFVDLMVKRTKMSATSALQLGKPTTN